MKIIGLMFINLRAEVLQMDEMINGLMRGQKVKASVILSMFVPYLIPNDFTELGKVNVCRFFLFNF